jgi:hypothetical protein
MRIRLTSGGKGASMLEKGWDRPQPWGTWMSGNEAAIIIGLDGPSRGDVELLVEARAQPIEKAEQPMVIVSFNSVELGRWQLPAQAGDIRRRFIVPEAVVNRSTEGHLEFKIPSTSPTPAIFGVQGLALRDARLLTSFLGYVDSCAADGLSGWALAEDVPVSVGVSVNGEPIAVRFKSVERPDLAASNLPTGAGFELKPVAPLLPGSKVDVRFANGRPLRGSPCEIK